jgi:hypothetical protein
MLHLNPKQVGYLLFLCLQMVYWEAGHPRHQVVAGQGFERPRHSRLAAAVVPDSGLPKRQVVAVVPDSGFPKRQVVAEQGFERPRHSRLAAVVKLFERPRRQVVVAEPEFEHPRRQVVVAELDSERPRRQVVVAEPDSERPRRQVVAELDSERPRRQAVAVVPNQWEQERLLRFDSMLLEHQHQPAVPGAANQAMPQLLLPSSFRYCGKEKELLPG